MSESLKKALTILASVVLWAVILLAAFYTFVTLATRDVNNVSSFMGYTPLTVQSDSMVPEFKSGDLIIIKQCDLDELEVGDVITFHTIIENQYVLNTHRITSIEKTAVTYIFTTKGDNNPIEDTSIVASGDVVGKYVGKIAGVGKVIDFLSTPVGFFIIIVLPMLLFFIYQVYHLIMVSRTLKRAQEMEDLEAKGEDNSAKLSEAEARVKELEAELAKAKQNMDKKEEE